MQTPTSKALTTFGKFVAWTVAAAAVDAILANLGILNLPDWAVMLIGAGGKSLATYIASHRALVTGG